MNSLITDVRYGLRMLIKTPGLSAVATLTIAPARRATRIALVDALRPD